MHRTKIITVALLGAAVSAVSGCMAVPAGPSAVPSPQPGRHSPDMRPRIVQGPGTEVLETISAAPSPTHRAVAAPAAPAAQRTGAAPDRLPAEPVRPRPVHPAHRAPRPLPPHPAPVPSATVDVCALGTTYGRWRPDSPQARICRRTYGN